MKRPFLSLSAVALLVLAVATPSLTHASAVHSRAAGRTRVTHQLPQGSASAKVFTFGVKGGSLRPWSVVLALDGSVTASGVNTTTQTLTTPQDTLKGLLTLAEAEGFFSMSKQIGCPGSGAAGPDSSARTIAISTSTGTKRVSVFGSCKAPFNQLYAVLQQIAGTSR
jgi:hypothetical protein